jgi:phage terminase large subunit GpA-like protein
MPPDGRPPEAEAVLFRAIAAACHVPPPRTVAEWADAERIVPPETGSPWPGPWRTERVPYLRQIMEVLTLSHPAREITFVKSAQVGGSEAMLNLIGQCMGETPAPIMIMLPSLDMMRAYNDLKLGPMIASNATLRRRVQEETEAGEASSTTTRKHFPGGFCHLVTANSGSNLQMRSARIVLMEEVSDYPGEAGGRGDPVRQLEVRTDMYTGREKIIRVSTPSDEGACRVTAAFERSSKGRFHVPCPDCGARQVLEWENLRWPAGRPEEARYHCSGCGVGIEHSRKPAMIAAGDWVHDHPELLERHAGFHLSGLYSPVRTWADLAIQWEQSQGDQEALKTFVQQRLGRAWRVAGEAPEWQRLYDRREEWQPGTVPAGALVLTAGIDVQRDRLEASVWGWAANRESWLVDHIVIPGSPFLWRTWEQVATLLEAVYPHESGGALPVMQAAVDSSDGVSTAEVYAFCRKLGTRRAVAVKGRDGLPQAIAPGGKVEVKRNGQRIGRQSLWIVGSSYLKGEFYGHLRLDRPTAESGAAFPAGYVHLPTHVAGEEVCRQLVAEELRRTRTRQGFAKLEWVKTRDRNEALDCRVYARAAAVLLGTDRWSAQRWDDHAAAAANRLAHRPTMQAALALPPTQDEEHDDDTPASALDEVASTPAPVAPMRYQPPPVPAVATRRRAWGSTASAW